MSFLDLPNELIVKIFSKAEKKDIFISGQVSQRFRKISRDDSLWRKVHMEIVQAEDLRLMLFLEFENLSLRCSTIVGSLNKPQNSQLRNLDIYFDTYPEEFESNEVLEELLESCRSLHQLVMEGKLTNGMVGSICKNSATLQILNLSQIWMDDESDFSAQSSFFLQIISCCQQLKELKLHYSQRLPEDDLKSLVENISPNILNLDLSATYIRDNHMAILLSRCNKIKYLNFNFTSVTDDSLKNIGDKLKNTLEELSLEYCYGISFTGVLELKCMTRLKILNVSTFGEENDNDLKRQLSHLHGSGILARNKI